MKGKCRSRFQVPLIDDLATKKVSFIYYWNDSFWLRYREHEQHHWFLFRLHHLLSVIAQCTCGDEDKIKRKKDSIWVSTYECYFKWKTGIFDKLWQAIIQLWKIFVFPMKNILVCGNPNRIIFLFVVHIKDNEDPCGSWSLSAPQPVLLNFNLSFRKFGSPVIFAGFLMTFDASTLNQLWELFGDFLGSSDRQPGFRFSFLIAMLFHDSGHSAVEAIRATPPTPHAADCRRRKWLEAADHALRHRPLLIHESRPFLESDVADVVGDEKYPSLTLNLCTMLFGCHQLWVFICLPSFGTHIRLSFGHITSQVAQSHPLLSTPISSEWRSNEKYCGF